MTTEDTIDTLRARVQQLEDDASRMTINDKERARVESYLGTIAGFTDAFGTTQGYVSGIEKVKHIEDSINKLMKYEDDVKMITRIEEDIKRLNEKNKKFRAFSVKDSAHLKPIPWTGKTDAKSWMKFAGEVKNWARAIHPLMCEIINVSEKTKMDVEIKNTEEIMGERLHKKLLKEDADLVDDMTEVLYQNLYNMVQGDGATFVLAHEGDRSGFDLWKELSQYFDPSASEDRSIEHAKVTRPETWLGKAKDSEAARIMLEKFEAEKDRYERKYGTTVDEMDLIVALKSIMPDSLFGETGKFRGHKATSYKVLKHEVVSYLNDRPLILGPRGGIKMMNNRK